MQAFTRQAMQSRIDAPPLRLTNVPANSRSGFGDAASDFLLQVLVSLSRQRIEEAVTLDGTTTIVGVREDRKTLEAELCHAAPAHHLVTLLSLRPLGSEILLAHAHLALRTLLRPRASHPSHQARIRSLGPLLSTPCLGSIRLA